jgi:hypothetical protein
MEFAYIKKMFVYILGYLLLIKILKKTLTLILGGH